MNGHSDTSGHLKISKGSFMSSSDVKSLGSLVRSIAELLRGDFKQSEYGKDILQFSGSSKANR